MTPTATNAVTTEDWATRRLPIRGASLDAGALALTGLEIMERYRDGLLPGPPVAHLTGLRIADAGPGTVTATMPLSPWLRWSRGDVPAAALALLADTPLGAACQTLLPPGSLLATAQMALAFSGPLIAGDTATAVGDDVEEVSRHAMRSRVAISGAGGAVARGTALMMVRAMAPPESHGHLGRATPPPPAQPQAGEGLPDAHPLPAAGEVLPRELVSRLSGLDLLRGLAAGELPAPPLQRLCGVRPTSVRQGASVWRMPAEPWLCSVIPGEVYGGATAMLTGMAALGTADTLAASGAAAELLQLTVRLRSRAAADGGELLAHGVVLRRLADDVDVRVQAIDRRGSVVATALATCRVGEHPIAGRRSQ